MNTPPVARERVRCRLVAADDLPAVTDLLCEGFKGRPRQVWEVGLARMTSRDVPEGAPRYGYCLEAGGRLVGVILLIASTRDVDGTPAVFGNVGSWYVKEDYRTFAQLLVSMALRNKATTYTNVSPAPHTWNIVENQGYTRYCSGLFFAMGLLNPPARGVRLAAFDPVAHANVPDFDLLRRHQSSGCDVLVADAGGVLSGFVFHRYCVRGGRIPLPAMLALHAPDQGALVRLAGNISRYFLTRAAPVIAMDSDGPIPGLKGMFTASRGRKYFKGPHNPGLCHLADSEYAIFGV